MIVFVRFNNGYVSVFAPVDVVKREDFFDDNILRYLLYNSVLKQPGMIHQ